MTQLEVLQQQFKSSRPLQIFLCHSSDDKAAVRDLYQRLRTEGFNPWLDEEKLLPGQEWLQEITKAVHNSDVVIVCLSHGAINKSGFIHKEIKYALDAADEKPEGTIFLIPLKLEECDLPERLRHWHSVSLFEERGFERLMLSLRKRESELKSAKEGTEKAENALKNPKNKKISGRSLALALLLINLVVAVFALWIMPLIPASIVNKINQELIPLLYYSLGVTILSIIHTKFHIRHWPKCKACISHSFLIPILIGIIAFIIGIISISFIDNYLLTFFIFTFFGTFPLIPSYSFGLKPILISSKSLWLFSGFIGVISSANIIVNRMDNQILFKLISQYSILYSIYVIILAYSGLLLIPLFFPSEKEKSNDISPEAGPDIINEIWKYGEVYIIVSWLWTLFGIIFLLIVPLISVTL